MKRSAAIFAAATMTTIGLVAPTPLAGAILPTTSRAATWGLNTEGQLGDNGGHDSTVPVAVDVSGVLAGKAFTALSAGDYHSCVVADGQGYCWGLNVEGGLGDGHPGVSSSVPVAVDMSGALAGKRISAISGGAYHTCAIADGAAYCWGYNPDGELGNGPNPNTGVPVAVSTSGVLAGKTVTAISAGYFHTCAVADGKAYCWGMGTDGQLGNNTTANSSVPVSVTGALAGKTVTAISASANHTCAVADAHVYCWGNNGNGKLGNNSLTTSKVPVAVDVTGVLANASIVSVATGYQHSCALSTGGAAYCWGLNTSGQLGQAGGSSKVPIAVDTSGALAGKAVHAITAGGYTTCAIADNHAYCWGYNQGALGDGGYNASAVPVAVSTTGVLAGTALSAVDCGFQHASVLYVGVPRPPTAVTGAAGDGRVSLTWSTPLDDGGSPVLDFTAIASPGGATCITSATSCAVTGLTNGVGYTFTVTARNAVGTSQTSAPSPVLTPVGPAQPVGPPTLTSSPGKVTGVTHRARKGTVRVSWSAVPGAASYRVRISKPGGTKYRAWHSTTKRAFKAHVKAGKKYRFQVQGVGAGGTGPVTTVRFSGK